MDMIVSVFGFWKQNKKSSSPYWHFGDKNVRFFFFASFVTDDSIEQITFFFFCQKRETHLVSVLKNLAV